MNDINSKCTLTIQLSKKTLINVINNLRGCEIESRHKSLTITYIEDALLRLDAVERELGVFENHSLINSSTTAKSTTTPKQRGRKRRSDAMAIASEDEIEDIEGLERDAATPPTITPLNVDAERQEFKPILNQKLKEHGLDERLNKM